MVIFLYSLITVELLKQVVVEYKNVKVSYLSVVF